MSLIASEIWALDNSRLNDDLHHDIIIGDLISFRMRIVRITHASLIILWIFVAMNSVSPVRLDGSDLCKANCNSTARLIGPTKPTDTRQHPWLIAEFPAKSPEFCKLGCQSFFTDFPSTALCKANCELFYRFDATEGYSNLAVEAKLECFDGCEIGYEVCEAGHYCTNGRLIPCPAGTYRGIVANISVSARRAVHSCLPCPYGTFRSRELGVNTDDCTKCPVGKYLDARASTSETDCVRCPAGKWSDTEGMRFCKCINNASCDDPIIVNSVTTKYFNNTVDFYRETVPFIGRW